MTTHINEMKDVVSMLVQPVLYLCAENAEVQENGEQKQITRKPKDKDQVKDVYREIRKWDVGYRIGSSIRKYNSSKHLSDDDSEKKSSSHSRPRPHTRRGHWHHYWRGSVKDNSRELILKWTAPMFINGNDDDSIPTEHIVK